MRSLQRRIKRNKARLLELPFLKNDDGSNKIIVQRKTTRGRWVNN